MVSRPCPSRPAASFNALLSASPSPRHDVLMACSGMAGDWGWRKERYPLHAMSWVAFDGEGPPCIGKPPSLPESACRSGPASESALFPERLMMLALQSAV